MDIFIYGTGGHAKVVYDTILSMTGYEVVCFIDDESSEEEFLSLPILKTPEAIKLTKTGIVAIGSNHIRQKVISEILSINANIKFVSAIHSKSIISPQSTIRPGTVVMAGAIINAGSVIESHCVVNTGAILEHDCLMKRYSSIAPGTVVGGHSEIGERSFLGLGAKLKHGIVIGDDTVVGMGSIVTQDINSCKVAFGSPCKEIKGREKEDNYL